MIIVVTLHIISHIRINNFKNRTHLLILFLLYEYEIIVFDT